MNFDSTGVTTTFNSWNSTDWSSFASALNTNWINGWTGAFTIDTHMQSVLSTVNSDDRSSFIARANKISTELSLGHQVYVGGMVIDFNAGYAANTGTHYRLHLNLIWVTAGYCLSCWIEIIKT